MEQVREKLNRLIEDKADRDTIYRVSVELDKLIEDYLVKQYEQNY